jgi:integrase
LTKRNQLTAKTVETLITTAKPGYTSDGSGLYLQISRWGSASWAFRYRIDGRLREMGLGSARDVTLAKARAEAQKHRETLIAFRHGETEQDPLAKRRADLQRRKIETARAVTFRQCGAGYIKAHEAGWKNAKHAAQWGTTLETYAYPILGDLPVQAVDTGLVMQVIEPMWAVKPETASRVRGRIESILDWATVSEYRKGENPARWRGHLEHKLPKLSKVAQAARAAKGRGEHYAAMPYDDVPAFMFELRQRKGAMSARALEFTILTVKRTEEILGARRREVERAKMVWTIPAGRMKGEREHRVALSAAAMDVLEKVGCFEGDPNGYIFSGLAPGQPLKNILKYLQDDMGTRKAATVHGFRSSFRDWASECCRSIPNVGEVAEMALAHVVDDKVEAAYRRGDLFEKRAQLMEEWAAFCAQPAPAGNNVLPIRAGL